MGDRGRALEYYELALPIQREVGNQAGEATTLNNLGHVYSGLGDRGRALEYYELALPIQRKVGDRAGEAVTRYNIAMIYRQRGELVRAISELEQTVELDGKSVTPTCSRTPRCSNRSAGSSINRVLAAHDHRGAAGGGAPVGGGWW